MTIFTHLIDGTIPPKKITGQKHQDYLYYLPSNKSVRQPTPVNLLFVL